MSAAPGIAAGVAEVVSPAVGVAGVAEVVSPAPDLAAGIAEVVSPAVGVAGVAEVVSLQSAWPGSPRWCRLHPA